VLGAGISAAAIAFAALALRARRHTEASLARASIPTEVTN
jgi:hypothetical protein